MNPKHTRPELAPNASLKKVSDVVLLYANVTLLG
jgi:hypothetical protein